MFAMDPRRYRLRPQRPPTVINLVDYEIIDFTDRQQQDVEAEETMTMTMPKHKHVGKHPQVFNNNTMQADGTSTIASMDHLDLNKIQLPILDALMCPAATLLDQYREESPSLVDNHELVEYVEDREEAEVDFDCTTDPSELWFGCLMDAAEEAAELFREGIVGISDSGHELVTDRLLERQQRLDDTLDDRNNKKAQQKMPEFVDVCDLQDQEEAAQLDQQRQQPQRLQQVTTLKELPVTTSENTTPQKISDVVNVCDLQDQEEAAVNQLQKQQQDAFLTMLPVQKKQDPPSKKEIEEATFPLLEIHILDTAEDDDISTI